MSTTGTPLPQQTLASLARCAEPWTPEAAPTVACYDSEGFARGEPVLRASDTLPAGVRRVELGDLLLSRRRGAPHRAWVVGESRGLAQVATPEWWVLRSHLLDPHYARHVLVSDAFLRRAGAAMADPRGAMSDPGVPLPPLAVQARAVRILDRADALRGRRVRAVECLREFEHALFEARFGRRPEDAFTSVALGACLVQAPACGLDLVAGSEGPFPLLRQEDFADGGVDPARAGRLHHADPGMARAALDDEDILLARAPARAAVQCVLVRPGASLWFLHASLWRLRADRALLEPAYLLAWLRSPAGERSLARAWSAPGSRARIGERLSTLQLPLPPLASQQAFATQARAAEHLGARMHASSRQLDGLLGTLRDQAYRGALALAAPQGGAADG